MKRLLRIPVAFLLLTAFVVACQETVPTDSGVALSDAVVEYDAEAHVQEGNPFRGSWVLTSVLLGNEELMLEIGLGWKITFRSDFSFSSSVSNDDDHVICRDPAIPPQTSCEWKGTYTYTATTIKLIEWDHPDPDNRGEDTSLYAICGGKMFWLEGGDEDGGVAGMRATFQKTGDGR